MGCGEAKIKIPPKNRRDFSLTLKTTNIKSVEIIYIYTFGLIKRFAQV
jgi:hypothetical protein